MITNTHHQAQKEGTKNPQQYVKLKSKVWRTAEQWTKVRFSFKIQRKIRATAIYFLALDFTRLDIIAIRTFHKNTDE